MCIKTHLTQNNSHNHKGIKAAILQQKEELHKSILEISLNNEFTKTNHSVIGLDKRRMAC